MPVLVDADVKQMNTYDTDTRSLNDMRTRIQLEKTSSPGFLQPDETDEAAVHLPNKTASGPYLRRVLKKDG